MAHTYSPSQLAQFLSYIQVPAKYHGTGNSPLDLNFLTVLHTHMLSAVPFEDLSLHYSTDHEIKLEPEHLFQKIVGEARGRGGYCMEISLLYNSVLRSLGFRTYTVGVKIRLRTDGVPQGDYTGWVHIVIIVTLDDGSRWMVDAGFGGDGPTKPIPLVAGHEMRNIGTQDIRLLHDFIPGQTDMQRPEGKMWIYQCRNGTDKPWNSFYAFSDVLEWLPNDFNVVNFYTSKGSPQLRNVLVLKFLRRAKNDGSGDDEIFGKRMLVGGVVKENVDGKTKVVHECKTEEERVEALRHWFDIRLTRDEEMGIRGLDSELKG